MKQIAEKTIRPDGQMKIPFDKIPIIQAETREAEEYQQLAPQNGTDMEQFEASSHRSIRNSLKAGYPHCY
ncbi:hypothetical protein [Sphingobacterium sp.]|uniref:hypothetical protein n=1 Tax=Sphingobacterium sp. TaxID=341027 RepID=UPI0031D1C77C